MTETNIDMVHRVLELLCKEWSPVLPITHFSATAKAAWLSKYMGSKPKWHGQHPQATSAFVTTRFDSV